MEIFKIKKELYAKIDNFVQSSFYNAAKKEISMGNYEELMRKIREHPEKYLGEKSFKALQLFLSGCRTKWQMDTGEKETGLDFFKHFVATRKSAIMTPPPPGRDYTLDWIEFNYFVHTHYNRMINLGGTIMPSTSMSPMGLIAEMSSSDEEAFDNYFELREAFIRGRSDGDFSGEYPSL